MPTEIATRERRVELSGVSGVSEERVPVLVGAAQLLQRDVEPVRALEPLGMLERVARGAAEDAALSANALQQLDSVGLIHVMAWNPQNGPRLLTDRIGVGPCREVVCGVGGETPVKLVNELARQIARGESKMALAVGCHNAMTLRRAREQDLALDWTVGGEGQPEVLVETVRGLSELEPQYGLAAPASVYPIFENALRAQRGLDLEIHRRRMGELFSPFTEVAARNPYAWFPRVRSPEELTTVTPQNRMVTFPYPKYLNAVMTTDQASAVLLMSAAQARALGIPEARWIYWLGGAEADEEAWFPSQRPNFAACPAMRASLTAALGRAGVTLDQIDRIDFYSCFPIAVSMACEMSGLAEDDPRGFTVTGGLPYAGGPGNNYGLHAIASMADELRAGRGPRGLVTGNGWYLTKHAALVLSAVGPSAAVESAAGEAEQDLVPRAPVPIVARAEGRASVETYTVIFERGGEPGRGIVIGRLESGERFIANTPNDVALLEAIVGREMIGTRGKVTHADGLNRFDPS